MIPEKRSAPPAYLGGEPTFPDPIPFAQPTFEAGTRERALDMIDGVIRSGMLTDARLVAELEERSAEHFQVGHCIAVSSCTIGLMLVVQALEPRRAVVPSFTFSATAHAARWNSVPVVFADCDPASWCLSPSEARFVGEQEDLVIGVHVSGVPCDVVGLEKVAAARGAELIFDAAHGAGSQITIDGVTRPLGGFGRAEVFSLTPTKVMSSAEGGLVTTNDADLAARIRLARNYGNPGDYDTRLAGLNARMSELHAALALLSLESLEQRAARRNQIADLYRSGLSELPGIDFQQVPAGSKSSWKDFTIRVDEGVFGASRDAVVAALHTEGIPTRPYYSPPVHRQAAYRDVVSGALPVTDLLASQVISLPMSTHIAEEVVQQITDALSRIRGTAERVEAVYRAR